MSHYYDADPTTPSDRKMIDYRINGRNFQFYTDTSVFSRKEIDFGTDFMLQKVIEDIKSEGAKPDTKVLDLGCGCGVVGIVIKSCFMKFDVTQVDVNKRAVELSKDNSKLNGVKMFKCTDSDVLSSLTSEDMFDKVITNPPVRAGKQTVFAFYEQAFEHMNSGAAIYVVLQRKQGAPSSEKKLIELFGNCETLGISGGYRVMKAVKE